MVVLADAAEHGDEIDGLDKAEFGRDFFPDHQQAEELIVLADGSTTPAGPVLEQALSDAIRR